MILVFSSPVLLSLSSKTCGPGPDNPFISSTISCVLASSSPSSLSTQLLCFISCQRPTTDCAWQISDVEPKTIRKMKVFIADMDLTKFTKIRAIKRYRPLFSLISVLTPFPVIFPFENSFYYPYFSAFKKLHGEKYCHCYHRRLSGHIQRQNSTWTNSRNRPIYD